ncbi:hypothetical protein M758_1G015000 [Ceratodon purpureus]|uniref:Uncharacterized protein n=1 Tax=Ceratodon purpureus TaxID=3225 RepID=A0A8T0J1D7_CERPU|nr:hypothetical protein KC19_1G015700 [Ceratodon purpureus]KAG0628277.1 hypothetical protein M758_1G015000 [Ceratodon purpureus]
MSGDASFVHVLLGSVVLIYASIDHVVEALRECATPVASDFGFMQKKQNAFQ